jgi:hypothetical protein
MDQDALKSFVFKAFENFLLKPSEAAELINTELRRSKSTKDATISYWSGIWVFSELRRTTLDSVLQDPDKYAQFVVGKSTIATDIPALTDRTKAEFILFWSGGLQRQEADVLTAIDVSRVDARAVQWSSEYVALL